MKKLVRTKNFEKQLDNIVSTQPNRAIKIKERIKLFLQDRTQTILKDHSLKGQLNGQRSFSIGGDLRIIYQDTPYAYIFLSIGTHNQVYE